MEAIEIPVGARVELRGLQAKPDLNGKRGRVMTFVALSGRYAIRVDDHGHFNVKPKNLFPLADEQIHVTVKLGQLIGFHCSPHVTVTNLTPGGQLDRIEVGVNVGDRLVEAGGTRIETTSDLEDVKRKHTNEGAHSMDLIFEKVRVDLILRLR